MIARFNWQYRRRQRNLQAVGSPAGSNRSGWLLIGGLTALMIVWLGYRWLMRPNWLLVLPSLLAEGLRLIEAAGVITLVFLWLALWWRRWQRPMHKNVVPNLAELYTLSPAGFEKYVAQLFRQKGYQVKRRGRSGDQGVDLELRQPEGKRAIVQCKRYQNTVGPEVVRELFGTLVHERVAHAFLVTTADISDAARQWARNKPMTLIDGPTLVRIAAVLSGQSNSAMSWRPHHDRKRPRL
jgi:restriction system protein